MATHAGVWIDHQQAIVVLGAGNSPKVKTIAFEIGQPVRSSRSGKRKHSYTPNDFVAEDKLMRKVENDRKDYYDDVIASVRGASALLILGPGEAKGELSKRLKSKKLRGLSIELETSDKMTNRQLAAKVTGHFAKVSPSKAAAPKATAQKVAAKSPPKSAALKQAAKKSSPKGAKKSSK